MALIRCMYHGWPKAGGRYVEVPYLPYAGLGTLVCGRGLCFDVGFVWLTRVEAHEHLNDGRRVFLFPSSAAKVAVGEQITLGEAHQRAATWVHHEVQDYRMFHDGLAPTGPRLKRV